MPKSYPNTPVIRIAVIDGDPLRSLGFRACLGSERDFEIQAASLIEISAIQGIDLVVLGPVGGTSMDVLSSLRTLRPDLKVIVTGCNLEDDVILKALAGGARGCVDETAPVNELARAIRVVHAGSVWASRRVLSLFVERVQRSSGAGPWVGGERSFTSREKQVLRMLVSGCSNKEIAIPLGIEERTVKAHVAKLLRKVGVPNRIMLSMHAIKHSLVST